MCLFSMAISKSFAQGQSGPLRRLSMRLPFGRWMSMDFNGFQDSFANVVYYVSFRSHWFARAGALPFLHVIHLISFWPVLSFIFLRSYRKMARIICSSAIESWSPHTSKGRLLLPKWWPMARPECVDIVYQLWSYKRGPRFSCKCMELTNPRYIIAMLTSDIR